MDDKERLARDLAETLVDTQDTDVTKEDVASWHFWDVEEWLEAWGYFYYNGKWKTGAQEV